MAIRPPGPQHFGVTPMARVSGPPTIVVVPNEGKLEITVNVNITVDGEITAQSNEAKVAINKDTDVELLIPEFKPGEKLTHFAK